MTKPPFGYYRDTKDKSIIKIVPKEAEFIKMVYDLISPDPVIAK